jgi:hypothetical protein
MMVPKRQSLPPVTGLVQQSGKPICDIRDSREIIKGSLSRRYHPGENGTDIEHPAPRKRRGPAPSIRVCALWE